jgi:PAS domain S-box-containing protein
MTGPVVHPDLENAELRSRITELEETLRAIQSGEVDALVISTPGGDKVYTLENADQPYRLFVENMTEGAVTSTRDGTVLYCNAAFSAILRLPLEKIIGSSLPLYIAPGLYESWEELVKKACSGVWETEHLLQTDGRLIPVYLSVSPLSTAQGPGFSIVVTDLTRQKQDQQLIAEGNLATLILENVGEALVVCDPAMKVLRSNPKADALFGTSMVDAGLPAILSLRCIFPPAIGPLRPAPGECPGGLSDPDLISATAGKGIELKVRRPSGGESFVLLRSAKILDRSDTLIGYLFIFIDITERNKAEEALRESEAGHKRAEKALYQANRKLNLLSGITRHDIRNQLMIMQGFLAYISKEISDPGITNRLDWIITASNRISSTISFTKEYEQIGVHEPVWQDCRTLAETAAKEAPLGEVRMVNDLPAGIEIFADPLVIRAFYNLLDNAARHGETITTVRFCLEHRNGDRVIICEDDGIGVPADDKSRIFDHGFGKNTGMGLFLTREILSITDITITETGEPGKGARFEITVPEGMYRTGGDRVAGDPSS